MYIILTYDVNQKRVGKVLKICRKYLVHVQKSVFEGILTESRLKSLKNELQKVIDFDNDGICIFSTESTRYITNEQIGLVEENTNIL